MNEKSFWHPVAYSTALKKTPLAVTLSEESVVLWRNGEGQAKAMRDLCIHRGVALSLGKVSDGALTCAYHGWRYNSEGRCIHIPQLAHGGNIPTKARIKTFQCCERYGLVWVALEEPHFELPEVPELVKPEWQIVETGPFSWRSSAGRQVENFTDFAHFPFVHPELLGDPERAIVPPHLVKQEGNILYYEILRPEAKNTEEFPIFANPNQDQPLRHNRYRLYLPYTIVLRVGWPGTTKEMIYFFSSQPVRRNVCLGYCLIAQNYQPFEPDKLKDFEKIIFSQDQKIVESQRPEQVPFDLSAELHLKFDAVAVAYRRAMEQLGFELY